MSITLDSFRAGIALLHAMSCMSAKHMRRNEANWRRASLEARDRNNATNTSTMAGKELRIMPLSSISILTTSQS